MKASTHLAVRVENNVAVFTMPNHPGWMTFISASCKSSVDPGTTCSAVTVTVPTGEAAVVVISTTHHRNKQEGGGFNDVMCVVPITWDYSKMLVDLERPFVSSPERLLQVNKDHRVVVTTGGQRFVSATSEEREKFIGSGYRAVTNPNLLLRFAVGQATLEDLEAAATMDKRSQIERELAQARTEIETLRGKLAYETGLNQKAKELASSRFAELATCRNELAHANERLHQEEIEVAKLRGAIAVSINKSEVGEVLLNQLPHHTRFGFLPWVRVRKLKKLLGFTHVGWSTKVWTAIQGHVD